MTRPSSDQPPGGGDPSYSGDDITEAVEKAERGSSVQDVHDDPTASHPGEAPVERAAGDPEMTEGQVVLGDGEPTGGSAAGGGVESESSGAAQAVRGARASDLRAAGEDV
jgi:hypothetical protein